MPGDMIVGGGEGVAHEDFEQEKREIFFAKKPKTKLEN